jgi:hypothetical protein
VAPLLRFQQQGEGRIALDVDPLDRIHLHRDFQAHDDLLGNGELKANKPLTFYRHYSRSGTCVDGWGQAVTLPKLSIAAKLYAIFALMAIVTVALSVVAVSNAREHAALTDEFESANAGNRNVERINGLIYAVMMESRGIYLSQDRETAVKYAEALLKANDQIGAVIADWQGTVRISDATDFSALRFASRNSRISRPSSCA